MQNSLQKYLWIIILLLCLVIPSYSLALPQYQVPMMLMQNFYQFPTILSTYFSDFYIVLQSSTQLILFDTTQCNQKFKINISDVISVDQKLIDLEIEDNINLYLLATKNITPPITEVIKIKLDQVNLTYQKQNVITLSNSKGTDLQLTYSQIIVLNQNKEIIRIDKAKKIILTKISTLLMLLYNSKIKTCNIDNQSFYMINWISYCQFSIFQCRTSITCQQKNHYNNKMCNSNSSDYNLSLGISFSKNCSYLAYQVKNQSLKIQDLSTYQIRLGIPNLTYIASTLQMFDQPFSSLAIDQYGKRISIYQITPDDIPNIYLNFTLSIKNYTSFYYFPSKKIIVIKNTGFYIYKLGCLFSSYFLGLCIKCKPNCLTCDLSGNCLTCKTSYSLNSSLECELVKSNTTNYTQPLQKDTKPLQKDNRQDYSDFQLKFANLIFYLINSTSIKKLSKIPGNRIIMQKLLIFLIDIQNVWLYSYYNFNLGKNMEIVFATARNLQKAKTVIINDTFIQKVINIFNTCQVKQKIDYKKDYQQKNTTFIKKMAIHSL